MATIAVSPEALCAVDVGSWLMVGVLEESVTMELGSDEVETDSGSVPVATMAVSSEALWAVEVGSWLIGVVGLGLIVDIELMEDIPDMADIEDTLVSELPVASGTEASDSAPGPLSSCRFTWRTCSSLR